MSNKPILIPSPVPNSKAYYLGQCTVIVAIENERWHLSIANRHRYPTWDEIKEARDLLLPGDIFVAMVMPPKEYYVNLHQNCFHLWEMKDGGLIEIVKGM
jgi:hypothetical protein